VYCTILVLIIKHVLHKRYIQVQRKEEGVDHNPTYIYNIKLPKILVVGQLYVACSATFWFMVNYVGHLCNTYVASEMPLAV
jgi:hypothetical protein